MAEKNASRVLIVDDVPINCVILSSLLASNGVSSDVASGGKECLELYEKNQYDLILLDHRMPEIDGVDTLVQLKEMFRKSGREIPVVCHTTEDAKKNINLYKAAGFADVLIKPIEPKRLSEILMTYLPEGEYNEDIKKNEKEKIDKELSEIPDWIREIDGLDPSSGIEHCETAEDYLDALTVYASSISEKAAEIENFLDEANWKMYTLRVHSLKSMSRLIGAEEIADIAAGLEHAGKQQDVDTLMKRTPGLLEKYRRFAPLLAPILSSEEILQRNANEVLPDISDATLKDAYQSISDFTACYDMDSIQMVLDSLKEYNLSEEDGARIKGIAGALYDMDWEKIRNLLKEVSL